jgi:hypothetical protein
MLTVRGLLTKLITGRKVQSSQGRLEIVVSESMNREISSERSSYFSGQTVANLLALVAGDCRPCLRIRIEGGEWIAN